MDEAMTNTLIAFYQGWVSRRGAGYLDQHERYYWCARDHLSMVNGDLHRTDEDFPLQHRHYAAKNLAVQLKRSLEGRSEASRLEAMPKGEAVEKLFPEV